MGSSHPSRAERMQHIGKDGAPAWFLPPGVKSKYDFPRAKEGKRERLEFVIGERHPGKPRRLDKYLQERFPGYSRSFLQQMIKDQRVLINSKATKSSWHISAGEAVTMLLYPSGKNLAEEIPFEVVYKDEHILALAKPAGVLVHPARGHKSGTLYNGLLHYFRDKLAADPSYHIGTVHRLDEETSGIMVYALCAKAHGDLTRQFERRLVQKTYLCLVHGRADFTEKDLEAPLGADPANRKAVAVDGLAARPARTRFVKLAVSPCGQFSLLRAHPFTGRTHQIRAHAKALGHPLAGDPLYGGLKEHPSFKGLEPRVCLHAESLSLTHPATKMPMTLRARLPEDFRTLLEKLGFDPQVWM
ncbi:MAG: RluA family pseudouridine synthase [Planctomycetota bacterium]